MVDSTNETYNIKEHFYEQVLKKGSFEIVIFSNVIDYIFAYSTLITTLQCQEYLIIEKLVLTRLFFVLMSFKIGGYVKNF